MARIFPMATGTPKQRTITASEVWTAPAGVTSVSVTGKGVDGAPATWAMDTHTVMTCTRTSSNQTGGSVISKLDAVIDGSNASGAFSVGGTATRTITHQHIIYSVGPNNLAKRGTPISITRTVRGQDTTAVGSTDGNITHTPSSLTSVKVTVETRSGGGTGASAVGFGYTFEGGTNGPAVPESYANVPVMPGNPYTLTVPAGASMTFSWVE